MNFKYIGKGWKIYVYVLEYNFFFVFLIINLLGKSF